MFVLCTVVLSQKAIKQVTMDYRSSQEEHSGWIKLNLNDDIVGDKVAVLNTVVWCKATIPNNNNSPDINDCKAKGLLHLTLYPSKDAIVETLPEEPNTLYIDPTHIGGWDDKYQYDIIVHASVDSKTDLIQVVRFNPIVRMAVVEETTTKPSTSADTTSSEVATSSSSTVGSGVISTGEPSAQSGKYSWQGMLVVFGIGTAGLILTVLLYYGNYLFFKCPFGVSKHSFFLKVTSITTFENEEHIWLALEVNSL